MSRLLIAAAAAATALFAAGALAQAQGALKTFTDSQNRFTFQYPASLPVDVVARPNQPVNVLVGAADYECQIFVVDRPELAAASPEAFVRGYSTALAPEVWKRSMDGFALYNRQGTVSASSVDTTAFWPVQRAEVRNDASKPVVAAMHARPGLDVWHFCTSFDNGDHTAVFNQIVSSFAGPNDAVLKAQAEAAAAARAAASAAAAAPPPPEKGSSGRGRRKD